MWNVSFLRRFASRGRGGVDSDRGVRRKWLPPRTPLAKRHSGVYRQEAAGWLGRRDLQKAWGLAWRLEKESNRVRPATESSPPPEFPSQRYSNFSRLE